MAGWMPPCGSVHEVTEVATDIEMVAPAEVGDFVAAHGGRLYVWISVHPGFPMALCLLEASLKPPKRDVSLRRIRAPGFDVYLDATQRVWPKMMEFSLRRHHVEAYWNGLGWVA